MDYFAAAGISKREGCDKVWGQPRRCSVCPPAFPTIGKWDGKRENAMPKARVTNIIRVLFKQLALEGAVSQDLAENVSSKSLRCGGVSAAAGLAVRDGVLQGHGGWLHRTSLIHYDQMTEAEGPLVSHKMNEAIGRLFMIDGDSRKASL
jgi:hypothetical protein